jgi:hypothetical protein
MSFPVFPCGRIILALVLTGVLTEFRTAPSGAETDVPPLTNRQAAEQVLARALENLGIPEGNGVIVLCRANSSGTEVPFFRAAVQEFLLARGYRIRESGEFPEFRFGLDTLFVHIERKGFLRDRMVRRMAEARIGVVFRSSEEVRQAYRGSATYEDMFPAAMIDHAGRNDPFLTGEERSFGIIKPVVFGLVFTGLIWLLYSYRG